MTVSPFDHPFLSGLLGHDGVAAAFSFRAEIEAMLAFEMALARALASEKLIPVEAATALAGATARLRPDRQQLAAATARDGTPVAALVAEIRRLVGEEHAPHIHYGATAQDMVDTALALRLKGVATDLERMLKAVVLSLDSLAESHGWRALTGRTRMQPALPMTVADRVRSWRAPLLRHLARLDEIRPRVLVVQLGGAVGTHDVLGERGPAVAKRMGDLLRLGVPEGPWHSQRDGLAELAGWLSLVTGTLGKLGQDLLLMAQPELDEVAISGAGGSMSVPAKQNQVGAEVLVALARFNATLLPGLHQALVHENEHSGAAWTLEWMLLPQMTVATATALDRATTVLSRITAIGRGAGERAAEAAAAAARLPEPDDAPTPEAVEDAPEPEEAQEDEAPASGEAADAGEAEADAQAAAEVEGMAGPPEARLPAGGAATRTGQPTLPEEAPTVTAAQVFDPPQHILERTRTTAAQYEAKYAASVADPDGFWAEEARRVDWIEPFTKVKNTSFAWPDVSIRWFEDGVLNVSANCIDRHLEARGEQTAIIWEPDDPDAAVRRVTYRELHAEVCRFANVLRELGVRKGERVTIYMPMIPEAAYAMLACARIGAVHSVVFGGFSPDALAGRINDCDSRVVITADEGRRGGRTVPLKANVDAALEDCPGVEKVLVIRHTGGDVTMKGARDVWWHEAASGVGPDCDPEPMGAEDPLFILYTSGSTGKPKGVLHTTGGYLVWAALTHEAVFDYRDGDVYWCTADVGWVTGHSYIVYGPLANGAVTLMFEGVPNYPDASRFWQVVDKHQVNTFYTAPTAIRALMGAGTQFVEKADLSSLRILGTVGEPINPEAWLWYHEHVGRGRCAVVDTWWQTETGGHMITPLPGAIPTKPGSATKPFYGVQPAILDPQTGEEITDTEASGVLAIKDSWPGQMRTVYGDHERFVATYFEQYKGFYFTGDGCRRDAGGDYWISGRVDDVLNVSGHRLGTAEIESALVAHPKVSEAAVVGYPHPIKGQGIYCYVTLMAGESGDEALEGDLRAWVRKEIGPIATPDIVQFAPGLPKTRSGKIMRRILRKVAENDFGSLGDTSTLADPAVVDDLIANRKSG